MFTSQAQNGPKAQTGPDLAEITTEQIGFQALAGEAKLRVVPPWPSNNLPKPTSSLLSIASRQELLAAAGPDTLTLGTTPRIRESFVKDGPVENGVKNFQPDLSISIPRVSQVVFSSDESTLTLCAAEGGGLAVYEVSALKQGNKDPAFQLSTNGIPVRALVPNPASETAEFMAVVLEQGQLMVANLKQKTFVNAQGGGQVWREGVSCVSWSSKGKALTAGFGDGSALQIKGNGEVMATIPRYPQLNGDMHVSALSWLDNDHWLVVYTPSQFGPDSPPDSTYVYLSRQNKTQNFSFQKIQDPCVPFGMNRSPPHHFIARFRDYKPALTDCLLLASTAAGEVGMITCHQTPLVSDALTTANQYTTTAIGNDSRKAQLPVDEDMRDTSAIGMALDVSGKEPVRRPIPAEEIEQSATPLPGLVTLNNEGLLSYWWFVYNQAVRQQKGYSGLIALAGVTSSPAELQQTPEQQTGMNGLTTMNGFGAPKQQSMQTAFGQPSTPAASTFAKPTFGSSSTPQNTGALGGASTLGGSNSPWGAQQTSTPQTGGSAFGQSGFGQSSKLGGGSGFGAVGGLGQSSSPWAAKTPQQSNDSKPNPFASGSHSTPFGASSSQQNQQQEKPLSSFGGLSGAASGFGSLGQTSKPLFGEVKPTATTAQPSSFGSTMTLSSGMNNGSFGQPSSFGEPKSAWGTPSLSKDPSSQAGKAPITVEKSPEAEMQDDTVSNSTITQNTQHAPDHGFGIFKNTTGSSQSPFGGFKVQSSFKADEENKQEGKSQPTGPSLFGSGFGNALGATQSETKEKQKLMQKSPFGGDRHENVQATKQQAPSATTFDGKQIKQEPVEEPEAPLPPSPKLDSKQVEPGPAPLPPSPKIASSTNDQGDDGEPPLPPFVTGNQGKDDLPPSPAGSSPVDLGAKSSDLSSVETTPEKPQDQARLPSPSTPEVTRQTSLRDQPTWGFPADTDTPKTSADAPTPSFTPSTIGKAQSTPFTNKPAFSVAPPAGSEETGSPRSPSPSRRFAKPRNFTSPSPARSSLFPATPTAALPDGTTPSGSRSPSRQSRFGESARLTAVQGPVPHQPQRTTSRDLSGTVRKHKVPEREEQIFTEDDDSATIKQELDGPIQPSKKLADFLAHKDYIGGLSGSSLVAQCEIVYRDINSMIDTLGLNARSLRSWCAGHEQYPDHERQRYDFEDERGSSDWSLIELPDLGILTNTFSESLEADSIDSVKEKVADLIQLRRECLKMKQRHYSIQQSILTAKQAEGSETSTAKAAPLPQPSRRTRSSASPSPFKPSTPSALNPEQTHLLLDLRKSYTSLTQQLSTAESSLSEFRAHLATASTSSPAQLPTVEAVIATITKMTRMAETKSGDLDVLEARAKRLKIASRNQGRGLEDVMGSMSLLGRSSREGTPLGASVLASSTRTPLRLSYANGRSTHKAHATHGRFGVPEGSDDESDAAGGDVYRTPLSRSVGSNGPAARGKGRAEIPMELVERYTLLQQRRQKVIESLKLKVKERGTRISSAIAAS